MGGVGEPGEGSARPGAPLPTLRWEQIRQHNLPGDKWLVIERRVYDISRWAQRHPGGSRLIGHHGAEDATDPELGWTSQGRIPGRRPRPCVENLRTRPGALGPGRAGPERAPGSEGLREVGVPGPASLPQEHSLRPGAAPLCSGSTRPGSFG